MRYFAIVVFALLILGSCRGGRSVAEPPVDAEFQVTIDAQSKVVDGQEDFWRCVWIIGPEIQVAYAPFTVEWDFGGGAINPPPQQVNYTSAMTTVLMRSVDPAITEYTLTVTVTDASGTQGTATSSYSFFTAEDLSITVSSIENELDVSVSGGNGPYTVRVSEPTGLAASQSQVETSMGNATFTFSAIDPVNGGGGLCFIVVEDKNGLVNQTDTFINIDPLHLNDDTLYAIPLKHEVRVDEPVTILVATGRTAHPFQFMLNVGLTVDPSGSYVPGTLNYGSIGGAMDDADGVWADITSDGGFILGPDVLFMNGANPDDSLGNRLRWDMNISPLGGRDVPSVKGSLISLDYSFSSPGLKSFGFQLFNGVNRTYYSDLASSENRFWSVLMADEMGNLHPSLIGQVDNTILVTE